MTAQTPDLIELGARTLSIQGVRGGELFEPHAHGLEVTMISTACWRGYVATYALDADQLVLRHLDARLDQRSLLELGVFFELELDGVTHPIRRASIVVGDDAERDGPGAPCDVHLAGVHPFSFGYLPRAGFTVHRRGAPRQRIDDGQPLDVEGHTLLARAVEGHRAYASAQLPSLGGAEGRFDVERILARYRGVDLPLAFDGGLLACDGFIRELYVHMGFHPAWKFEHVEELVFDKGKLIHREDVSDKLAVVRERLANAPREPREKAEVEAWVKRCFELDY